MTVENISWSISTKECCQPRRGLNPRPPGLQSDGASNWATEAGIFFMGSDLECWNATKMKFGQTCMYGSGDIKPDPLNLNINSHKSRLQSPSFMVSALWQWDACTDEIINIRIILKPHAHLHPLPPTHAGQNMYLILVLGFMPFELICYMTIFWKKINLTLSWHPSSPQQPKVDLFMPFDLLCYMTMFRRSVILTPTLPVRVISIHWQLKMCACKTLWP